MFVSSRTLNRRHPVLLRACFGFINPIEERVLGRMIPHRHLLIFEFIDPFIAVRLPR